MFNNAKQDNHLNNKHKIYLLLLITIVLSIPIRLSSAQTIYKWVDDNGSVHYGGNPPMNITEFNTLRIENVPKSEAPIAPSSSEDKKIPKDEDKRIPKEKKKKQDKQNKSKYATKSLDHICALYKKKLNHYISRMRAGYEAKQYNHLEGKRREYRRKMWQYCREGSFVQPHSNNP